MSSKPKHFTLSPDEFEKQKDKITEAPSTLEYPHHVGSVAIKPEDKGKIKGLAVSAMHEQTHVQLKQIYDQIQQLMNQANAIKERVTVSERLYEAKMSFKPLIGHTYHLYRQKDGSDVLSMVAPTEWGKSIPFDAYVSTVRLLSDHTWDIIESGDINDM